MGPAAAFLVLPAVFGIQHHGAIRALLRSRVLVLIGLVSYGIYLWHAQVMGELVPRLSDEIPMGLVIALALAVTLAIAAASYMIVERPIIFWSTGRAAPKITDLKVETLHPISATVPTATSDGEPVRRSMSGHVTVALTIVVVALAGLLIRGSVPSPATLAEKAADPYQWRGPSALVWDSFDRPDQPGLGPTSSGMTWQELSGTWSITHDEATAVIQPTTSFAVLRPAPGRVTHVRAVVNGASLAGIAFRCQDAQNCFWVQALPEFHTWNVAKIVRGRLTVLGNVGLLEPASRTAISVHDDGEHITVAVGDVTKRTFVDSALRGTTGVGLASGRGGTTDAHWTQFEADVTGAEPQETDS